MIADTQTSTNAKQEQTGADKVRQLRELFADAPELGKKALEKGSSSRVGSSTEIAPAGHCSRGRWYARQSRRTSQAISGKVMAKRSSVPAG